MGKIRDLYESKDANGQEHAANGQFTSKGGSDSSPKKKYTTKSYQKGREYLKKIDKKEKDAKQDKEWHDDMLDKVKAMSPEQKKKFFGENGDRKMSKISELYEDNGSVANIGEQPEVSASKDDDLVVETEDEIKAKVDDDLMVEEDDEEDEEDEDKSKKDDMDESDEDEDDMMEEGIEDAVKKNPPDDPDSKPMNYIKKGMEEEDDELPPAPAEDDEAGTVVPPEYKEVAVDLADAIVAALADVMGDEPMPSEEPVAPPEEEPGEEPAAPAPALTEPEPEEDQEEVGTPEPPAPSNHEEPDGDEEPGASPDEEPAGDSGEEQVAQYKSRISDLESENQALRDKIKDLQGDAE